VADRRPPSRPAAGPGQRRRLRGRLARLFGDVAQVFGKTAQDLNINDPGVVAPALFELVYTTRRPIRRSNAGTRDAPRGCHGTSCASPSVRFSWSRPGRRRTSERDVLPKLDAARLPPASRSGPGRAHAALVRAPEVEGRRLAPYRSLDHAGSQGRRERCGDRLDRRALINRLSRPISDVRHPTRDAGIMSF
jgi:hypothetical protein